MTQTAHHLLHHVRHSRHFFPSSADHHFHVIGDLGSMVLQLRVGVSDRNSPSTSIPHGILQLLVHEERKDVLATGGLDELAI